MQVADLPFPGPESGDVIRYSFVPFIAKIYEKGGRAILRLVWLAMNRREGSIYIIGRYGDTCCGNTQRKENANSE